MIKDSGTRREFETGATRDIQEGKGRCDLLPLDVAVCLMDYDDRIKGILLDIEEYKRTGDIDNLKYCLRKCSRWNVYGEGSSTESHASTLLDVSKHFEEGAKKYGEYNWQKGIPTHCYIDSAVRHFLKFIRGDDDEPHDRAFVWNILCCMWTCKNKPELNDYPRKEVKEPEKEEVTVERCCKTCMYPGDETNLCCKNCARLSGFDNPYPLWEPRPEKG